MFSEISRILSLTLRAMAIPSLLRRHRTQQHVLKRLLDLQSRLEPLEEQITQLMVELETVTPESMPLERAGPGPIPLAPDLPNPGNPSDTSTLRQQEMQWIGAHVEEISSKYHGRWIAVEGGEIVAVGESEEETDESARAKGVPTPFVIRIPAQEEQWVMG